VNGPGHNAITIAQKIAFENNFFGNIFNAPLSISSPLPQGAAHNVSLDAGIV
jgi:hypothetical protein